MLIAGGFFLAAGVFGSCVAALRALRRDAAPDRRFLYALSQALFLIGLGFLSLLPFHDGYFAESVRILFLISLTFLGAILFLRGPLRLELIRIRLYMDLLSLAAVAIQWFDSPALSGIADSPIWGLRALFELPAYGFVWLSRRPTPSR